MTSSEIQAKRRLKVFSTCPQSSQIPHERYRSAVIDVARWSEKSGCSGILVYTDNGIADPWPVAQLIMENTQSLSPLVAVQPAYMHPYAVAKKISTLALLYHRRIHLNMVAGGFVNDLHALSDHTPHDQRYARLVEYTSIIQQLTGSDQPLTFDGNFYRVKNLRLTPAVPPELSPPVFLSGSSDAGMQAARELGATAIRYPKPANEEEPIILEPGMETGIRLGIIARETKSDAWHHAKKRFPENRKGQLTHQLAMKTSDSEWHRQLSELGQTQLTPENPYWLHPFENYQTFCPYLVGSYETVAAELSRYVAIGHSTLIVDIPATEDELQHLQQTLTIVERAG